MNERIEKLAMQANSHHDNFFDLNYKELDSFLEKFAELIVRECGDVAYSAYWANPEMVRGQHIKQKIKQHFGVE